MRLHPLSLAIFALASCVGISLYTLGHVLELKADLTETTKRLQKLEAAVKKREIADPLEAHECVELGLGVSPDKPCETTLWRLAQTPQQFHGSWVMVKGIYASGFEHTAVYPLPPDGGVFSQTLDKHAALWVQLNLPVTTSRPVVLVAGKFERGPAGHMGQYFGELVDAKVLSINKHVTP
jgi:hypothetical protein